MTKINVLRKNFIVADNRVLLNTSMITTYMGSFEIVFYTRIISSGRLPYFQKTKFTLEY